MGEISIPVVCYADDAVLLAESQEDLQTLLNTFQRVSDRLNREIPIKNTKSMAISKTNATCNLLVYNIPIEQISKFSYLGVEISNNRT